MPGYNLQTYKDRFLRQAFGWEDFSTLPAGLGEGTMLALLNDALLEIHRRLDVSTFLERQNLTVNKISYDIPTTLLGRRIDLVERLGETGNSRTALVGIPYSQFISLYDPDNPTENTGNPIHWTFSVAASQVQIDTQDQKQILLGPPPKYSRTNGLIITASVQPDMVGRNYQSANPATGSAITASINLGDSSITISDSAPAAVEIQTNDEIGIVPIRQSDGSALSTRSPRRWYRITETTASSTLLTITPLYNERTTIGSPDDSFITAEVPEIEQLVPGLIGMLPVDMALAEYFRRSDPERSAVYDIKVEQMFGSLRPHAPRVRKIHSGPVQSQSSFFNNEIGIRIWRNESN